MGARGTHRCAQRDVAYAKRVSRQHEIADVRAGKQEDEPDQTEDDGDTFSAALIETDARGHFRQYHTAVTIRVGVLAREPITQYGQLPAASSADTPGASRPSTVSHRSLRSSRTPPACSDTPCVCSRAG